MRCNMFICGSFVEADGLAMRAPNAAQQPITFRKPHPATTIPMRVARSHGRRLTKTYSGWTVKTLYSSDCLKDMTGTDKFHFLISPYELHT